MGTPKSGNKTEDLYDYLQSLGIDEDTLLSIFGSGILSENRRFERFDKVKENIFSELEWDEEEFNSAFRASQEDNFNIYQAIKDNLMDMGLPEKEIAFIHDFKTERQKQKLMQDLREGNVRVVIGSTSKLGTGVNAQDKIVALHHIDVRWRPSDMEQRNGLAIVTGKQIGRAHV